MKIWVRLNGLVSVEENGSLFQTHFLFMAPKGTVTCAHIMLWGLCHVTTPNFRGGWAVESRTTPHPMVSSTFFCSKAADECGDLSGLQWKQDGKSSDP